MMAGISVIARFSRKTSFLTEPSQKSFTALPAAPSAGSICLKDSHFFLGKSILVLACRKGDRQTARGGYSKIARKFQPTERPDNSKVNRSEAVALPQIVDPGKTTQLSRLPPAS